MRLSKEYTIWDNVTPKAVTSSTDASPSVVTKASHGFSTGDRVIIFGHATNVSINGIYDVVKIDANTFTLKNINTGAAINGSGGGAGSGGVIVAAPKIVCVQDYRNITLSFITSGTATLTAKIAGSIGKPDSAIDSHGDTPNFGATQSKTNPYQFIQYVDLDTAAAVNGATGIAASGTDLNINAEINVNGLKYLTLIPTTWTAGSITAKVMLYDND